MRKLAFTGMILILATAALAGVVGKDGSTLPDNPVPVTYEPRAPRADFEWSSGGAMNTVPTLGGSSAGWGSHFIVRTTNTLPVPIVLTELGFPCGGPAATWMVWLGTTIPSGFGSPDFSGPFTPVDPDPTTFPPTTYTYVDVSAANIEIPAGSDFWFGYENPGIGGQVSFNGVVTYSWYEGAWDADDAWGRTAVMQVSADQVPVELQFFTVE